MKKIVVFLFLIIFPISLKASLGADLSGLILLDVERNGEAWYIYPEDNMRYFLGRPTDAFNIMRELGLGIDENNFQKIARAGMPVEGDIELAKRLSGKIIIQTEKNGEAWYIYPKDLKKYYLGRPKDAFEIMRELSLGINRENLALIHKPGLEESIDQYSSYEHKKISTKNGIFSVDLVTIDLNNPKLKIITDTASPAPSEEKKTGSFGAQTLGEFVLDNGAFAGVNGTYFDAYSSNQNYYFYPVYDSNEEKLINTDQLKYWTTGPIFAWDINNKFYYFKDSREFVGVDDFETKNNIKLQALIGNRPRLIEDKMNLLIEWDIDDKQRDLKADRNALGIKDNEIYLLIAHNATVPDLAIIMQALEVDHALNLDGGYSSALWYNDEYMVKPGRDIPNALVFSIKN